MIQDIENTEREANEIERNKAKGRCCIVSELAADWNYWQGPDKEMRTGLSSGPMRMFCGCSG